MNKGSVGEDDKALRAKMKMRDRIDFLTLDYYSKVLGVKRSRLISILFGVKRLDFRLSVKEKRELEKEAGNLASRSKHLQQELDHIAKAADLSEKDKSVRVLNLMDNWPSIMGFPLGAKGLDYVVQGWKRLFALSTDVQLGEYKFLSQTNFREYVPAIESIFNSLYDKDKSNARSVEKLLSAPLISRDTFLVLSSAADIEEHYKFLDRSMKWVKSSSAKQLIQIYEDISGVFEKQIRILVRILEIMEGSQHNSLRTAKESLGKNLNILNEGSPPFKLLVSPFNRNIRNAIAHKSYKVDIIKKEIVFVDFDVVAIRTFEQFLNEAKELSSVVAAIVNIYAITMLYRSMLSRDMSRDNR